MSFAQFGYHHPLFPAPQILTAVTDTTPQTSTSTVSCCDSTNNSSTCYQQECRMMIDASRYTTLTSSNGASSSSSGSSLGRIMHPSTAPLPSTIYPHHMTHSPFANSDLYPAKNIEPSSPVFYPHALNGQYMMKEVLPEGGPWHTASQHPYYHYDASGFSPYGYNGFDLGGGSLMRRKNATRETTSTLKAWLSEHRKNPYPTKGEKIMLAIITKMTLTQVSTWFANARRRLKKENKMTWEPRNRCDDDDDDDDASDDDDDDHRFNPTVPTLSVHGTSHLLPTKIKKNNENTSTAPQSRLDEQASKQTSHQLTSVPLDTTASSSPVSSPLPSICSLVSKIPGNDITHHKNDNKITKNVQNKPRIWSLADTATGKNDHEKTSSYSRSYYPMPQFCVSRTMTSFVNSDTPPQTPPNGYLNNCARNVDNEVKNQSEIKK